MVKRFSKFLCCVLLIACFVSCFAAQASGEEVTLKWYARINQQDSNSAIFEAASRMAKEKIGVNLDIIALENYGTKITAIIASGEDFDLLYTGVAASNIYQHVAYGNLLELDELLPKYAPELWESVPMSVWDGVRIDGRIYCVPNQQVFARAPGFMVPTQNIRLLGLNVEEMANWSLADYEAYLRAIKEKTGKYAYLAQVWDGEGWQLYGQQMVMDGKNPGAIYFADENPVVFNQFESEEYQEYIRLRAKWNAEGLTAPMALDENYVKAYSNTSEDEIIPWLIYTNTYVPGNEASYKSNYNIDVTYTTRSKALMTSSSMLATAIAVNKDSKHPEEAVKFINLLNTDKEFYNLVSFGIEGVNYRKLSDNVIETISTAAYSQPRWAIGNTFLAYLFEGQPDVAEESEEINRTAMRSPILGFTPDTTDVLLELANCQAVIKEYSNNLDLGLVDVEASYQEFIEKLHDAGSQKIIDTLNAQLQDWLKAN